ncbi:MAG: hypothetical protein M3R24_05420 [Chloroflexota bacterium]|nr:hypothetical protein [Chloroflexota bacterium]
MRVLILTGPPAAGKNTIATAFAQRRSQCAVIDVDLVRWMVVQPHKAPWEGDDGRQQQRLGVQNTCLLATNFVQAGFDVVIVDVVSQETVTMYRQELTKYRAKLVLLLPTLTEIEQRNRVRGPRLKAEEVAYLYAQQSRLVGFDEQIDNTHVSADVVAEYLIHLTEEHW